MKKAFEKGIKVRLLLVILFIMVLVIEGYLVYFKLYPNFSVEDDAIPVKNIVRVDLRSYERAIELFDKLENYTSEPVNLTNSNPFKF
jgi:hypothetical protein